MDRIVATDWWPLVSDQQGWPPNIQPAPGPFTASPTAELIFFFVAGAAVVLFAVPWAVRAAVRSRNFTPLLVMGSGLICSLLEPMLDMLGHLHWAHNLVPAFTNFGITVPALIPLCYVAFLGLEAYFCYFVIRNGAHVQHFMMLLGIGIITDAVMETIGINLGIYLYYGVQPYKFLNFPYWWGFINGGSFVTVGAVLAFAVPRLRGAHKLWLLLAAPFGMMVAYFRCRVRSHPCAQLDDAGRPSLGGDDRHDGDDGRLDGGAASAGRAARITPGAALDVLANLRLRQGHTVPFGPDGDVAEDVR